MMLSLFKESSESFVYGLTEIELRSSSRSQFACTRRFRGGSTGVFLEMDEMSEVNLRGCHRSEAAFCDFFF